MQSRARLRAPLLSTLVALFASRAHAQAQDDAGDPFADASGSASASGQVKLAGPAVPPSGGSERRLEAAGTLDASTGLLRTVAADSGAEGTFRVGIIESYFTGTGFLCGECERPDGTITKGDDDVSQITTHMTLSATPVDFLEAYGGLRYMSTSNDRGEPKAIQIVGDMLLGAKLFTPTSPDRIFSFGGALDGRLLSSAGGVGVDAGSFGIHALGTADLTRRSAEADRVPLRFHLNLGYVLDGSGNPADDVEESREKKLGAPQRITRVERFAHDINRVDSFQTAIGVEGAFKSIRPFIEWGVDLPVNRQTHDCGGPITRSAGDDCLTRASFSAVPSRLTLGARAYPWAAPWLEGFAVLAAFDIGTGATSSFIEEVAPEAPWMFHIGLSWAVDTVSHGAPRVVERVVEKPAPVAVQHFIEGVVKQAGKDMPVPSAIVRFASGTMTGLVADDQGKWRTSDLPPGDYAFAVTADGYKDGECSAKILAPEAPKPKAPAAPGAPAPAAPAAPPPATVPGPVVVPVTCELEALPRTATITGSVRDADTTQFVEGATVTITDPMGRSLALKTDAEGKFRFGNVVEGRSKLSVDAEGYLRGSNEVALEARRDVAMDIAVHARPKVPNVVVTKTEVKLKKEVHFLHGSAEILPDSLAILEEAADVLRTRTELPAIEIQGHTDDSGTPEVNQRLSTDRANAVRDVLVANGVDASRLSAHGYGQEKPLVPNTGPKNKAKNRRVQLMIAQ